MFENNSAPAPEAVVENTEATENQEVENTEVEADKAPAAVAATAAQTKAIEKQLKKYKLKVDGEESDFEIDLNNDEEVKKHFQMSKASSKKMSEAAELRKSAEQFIDMLKKNPRKVLSDPNIGVDLKNLAKEIIDQELEESLKSPEQIEKEKLQAELQELKDKQKKDNEDRKNKELQRLQSQHEQEIQTNIEAALKTGELPKTPYTVRKMAELMMLALENNIELKPKDLVPLLRKQMNSDIKELFSASSDDVLEELVGKDNLTRLRKRGLAKVKNDKVAQTAASIKQTGNNSSKTEEPKEGTKQTIRDFLKI